MADKSIEILVKGIGAGVPAGAGAKASGGATGSLLSGIMGKAGGSAAVGAGATGGGGLLSGLMGGLGIAGPIAAIAAGVMLIVGSSKALMKVLSGFSKMVMMILKPIGDVIAVLLMPLIWMLMPLVKVMNMLFMPLRKYLMKALSAQKEEFMSLDPSRIMAATMTAISHSFTAWFDTLFSGTTFEKYDKNIGFFNEFINELGEIGIVKPKSIIENLWDILVGNVTDFFTISILTGGIQALWDLNMTIISGFFDLIIGEENTQALFDTMNGLVVGFFELVVGDENTQTLFDKVNEELHKLLGLEPPKETSFAQFLFKPLELAVVALLGIYTPFTPEKMEEYWLEFTTAAAGLLEISKPLWESHYETIKTAIGGLVGAINWLIGKAKAMVKNILGGGGGEEPATVTTGNDFVMTPTGGLIKTNPSDYLFGTKNPSGMMGNGGTTINQTITIYAQDADETKRKLDDLISENMRRYR